MLVNRPHLIYEGADTAALAEGSRMLIAGVSELNMESLEQVARFFRGSRWLAMDTLARLMRERVELTVDDAHAIKSTLELVIQANKLSWSCDMAKGFAPLLRDLAAIALQERDERARDENRVRVIRVA